MNRLKSKENLNPNLPVLSKRSDNQSFKPRNQSRPPLKENSNNPQKSIKKPIKKKQQPKPQPKPAKAPAKQQPIAAQLYYEEQVLHYVTQLSTTNFKKAKLTEQNKIYRAYRQSLLESIYRECINFELKPETFYLYVYFLDNFMKTDAGRKLTLQNTMMANYASFLMAQKYEEIYPPSIHEWLPEHVHEEVYKWEGKIIFALNFKLIHESLHYFFDYWAYKFELKDEERKGCMILLESIAFSQDLMYKYEPAKIAKAVVLIESTSKTKKQKQADALDPFESVSEKNKIAADITKHITNSKKRIEWISNLRR